MTASVAPAKYVLTEVVGDGVKVDIFRNKGEVVSALLTHRDFFLLIEELLPAAKDAWDRYNNYDDSEA